MFPRSFSALSAHSSPRLSRHALAFAPHISNARGVHLKVEGREIAIVTGASRGIGKGIAEMLASRGFSVAAVSRGETVKKAAKSLSIISEGQQAHAAFQCDVGDPKAVNETIQNITKTMGEDIAVLVNCAGVVQDSLVMRLSSDEDIEKVIRTNLLGAIYMARSASKLLLKRKNGHIVNIGSTSGLEGVVGQTVYSAAKAGLVGVTRTWAKELGTRGIRVNLIAPGAIDTDMTQMLTAEQRQELMERTLLRRLGTEIVSTVAFVLDNAFITGQVIRIDGGLGM